MVARNYWQLVVVGALAGVLFFASVAVLVLNLQVPLTSTSNASNKTPTVTLTIYAGENGGKLGFGSDGNNLTSPGPTIRFTTSDVVSITVVNVGKMPHAFAITAQAKTGASPLFGAEAGTSSSPLSPGQMRTVVFAANNGGNFYYICPVPGHAESGMYGSVVITGG